MSAPNPYVADAAILTGWPAWVYARLLTADELTQRLERSGIRGDQAAPVLAAHAAIRRAGDTWHQRVSANGSTETVVAETVSPSLDELTTDEAADMLKLTPRRVRQLIDADELPARRVGNCWRLDPAAVAAMADERTAA